MRVTSLLVKEENVKEVMFCTFSDSSCMETVIPRQQYFIERGKNAKSGGDSVIIYCLEDKHGESLLLFGVNKLMYMDVSFSMFAVTEANKTVFFFQ